MSTSTHAPRKGASRTSDIPPDILQALSRGEIASATLTEGLALDQVQLVQSVFPQLPPTALVAVEAASQLGILKRMQNIGGLLFDTLGPQALTVCQTHLSDTVRGWACFMVGHQKAETLEARLRAIEPMADDEHFGVREWAWMAVRPHLANELPKAIDLLTPWTAAPSERVRRFASEALRPRGVWCAHIASLKKAPEQALPILEPLRADPATYVQDSVANWLNDAAKTQPEWVRELCSAWQHSSQSPATQRICQRALRSVS